MRYFWTAADGREHQGMACDVRGCPAKLGDAGSSGMLGWRKGGEWTGLSVSILADVCPRHPVAEPTLAVLSARP